jgi:nucleotide-binding universal stress UspA family protein
MVSTMRVQEIKKILLTTDLSSDATSAYPLAASLALAYRCQLTVLTCIDTSLQYTPSGIGSLDVPALYTSERMDELKGSMTRDLTEHIRAHFSELAVTHEVCEAPTGVQHTINNYIKDNQMRHCKKPVLVVPAQGAVS